MNRLFIQRTIQALIVILVEAITLYIIAHSQSGFFFEAGRFWSHDLIIPALVLGMANASIRPFMLAVTRPMGVLAFSVITATLNGFILWIFDLLSLLQMSDLRTMFISAVLLSIVNTILTTILTIDDEDRFYRKVIRRLLHRSDVEYCSRKGVLMVEIDGLAYQSLTNAIDRNRLPNLKRLLKDSTHEIVEWDCGIPSQTSSSQAGIMFGCSYNIPAFRWYDRESERMIISGHARDAHLIEESVSNVNGLLRGGSSVNNLLSGGADRVAITLSEFGRSDGRARGRSGEILQFFLNPYCLSRALILVIWELMMQNIHEFWSFIRKRFVHGPLYPLNRALSTVVLRDLGTYLVVQDLMQGVPAIYVSYIGYDVVSHLNGTDGAAALGVLSGIDRQIGRLVDVAENHAPRPYHIVILSDHGQSPGMSFRRRFGTTLTEYVNGLVRGRAVSEVLTHYPGYLRALLRDLEESETLPSLSKTRKQALRTSRIYLARHIDRSIQEREPRKDSEQVVVCCSGNLAHIYLQSEHAPLPFEHINDVYPELIPGLVNHPGIGFILVRSLVSGLLLLGPKGLRKLDGEQLEGVDPLEQIRDPDTAIQQLKRLGTFPNAGDLIVNSIIEEGRVASFEDQTGSHGGLGGPQNYPFIMLPRDHAKTSKSIHSPEQIYPILIKMKG